jgi:hypothetical protein
MPKNPESHTAFWKKASHLYGCYGGIFMCILVVCGFSNLSWYTASFWGYILGRIFYWIQGHFAEESTESVPIESQLIRITPSIEPIETPTIQDTAKVVGPLTVFDQFVILKNQVQPLLAQDANEKIQQIHSLLTLLNHKLNSSKNIETQRAIENIQRIINNYLTPTLTHYQELPAIFHNRSIDDGNTPDQLILQQLSLVQDELLQMTEDIYFDDLNALLEHGLFLEQKLKPTQFFKVGTDLAPLRSHSDPKILK